MSNFDLDVFQSRHLGSPDAADTARMLEEVGASSLDALMDEAVPARIRLQAPLDLPNGMSEHAFLRDLRRIASTNQLFRSYIGLGYYDFQEFTALDSDFPFTETFVPEGHQWSGGVKADY